MPSSSSSEGVSSDDHSTSEDEMMSSSGESSEASFCGSSDSAYSSVSSVEGEENDDIFSAFEDCILNFGSGEYDVEIRSALDNFLATNQERVTRVRRSRPADWDTMEALAADHLRDRLREVAHKIRYPAVTGRGGERFSFAIDLTSSNQRPGEGPVVTQEEHLTHRHKLELDSAWEKFDEALKECTDQKFNELKIPMVKLREDDCVILQEQLKGRIEKSLIFVQNNLDQGMIKCVTELVEGNPSLQYVRLRDNPMNNHHGAAMNLIKAVKDHPNLCGFSLPGCSIENNITLLSSILRSGIKEIVLNNNGIGTQGANVISEFLETNPLLEHLELDNNKFKDDDAVTLAQALKKNTNLKALFIRGNKFSVTGVKTMFRAIFDPSSMNSIYNSNHVCHLSLFSAEDSLFDHVEFLNAGHLEANRKRKIGMALFYSREYLLRYLAPDFPLELMPLALEYIQSKGGRLYPIDMVFTVMRYWEVPSLYSFRGRDNTVATLGRKRKHSR